MLIGSFEDREQGQVSYTFQRIDTSTTKKFPESGLQQTY